MKIKSGTFVSVDYRLSLEDGALVEESQADRPLQFIVGLGQMMPGLEQRLLDMEAGQKAAFTLEPDEAYGQHRPELRDKIPRDKFPADARLEEGVVFHAATPHGAMRFTILAVNEEDVDVDLNHPLAGKRLCFDVEVKEVREATDDERAAATCGSCCGHDHDGGCGGHQGHGCC
jgi:FKBP-type peptidyl-prolyl cis-trans isomerase SlyD